MEARTTNEALFSFIQSAPTPYHAISEAGKLLEDAGYIHLSESEIWKLAAGGKYFVTRNGTTLAAFRIPKTLSPKGFMISAAHSDAPAYKIKENPELPGSMYVRLAVEGYGGMICSTWLDRPLSVAGRVVIRKETGIESRLVNIDRNLLLIPNVAIHMNRSLNSGYSYNANTDMVPLFGDNQAKGQFLSLVAKEVGCETDDILSTDLFLYHRTAPTFFGLNKEYIACPRLDDLQCAFGTLRGFLHAETLPESASVPVCAIFDNEEVGSSTKQGAGSTFLFDLLNRICESLEEGTLDYRTALPCSMMVSADNAHAVHPNHPEYADGNHKPRMNGGIVVKYNASQRYTTDAISSALFTTVCKEASVPTQTFFNRADLAGGSTLGSISNTRVSLSTVDIGLPQLAMHSSYECAGAEDTAYLIKAMSCFFASALVQSRDGVWDISLPKASSNL